MKHKTRAFIVIGLIFIGVVILLYTAFSETEQHFLLPVGIWCITIGNIINSAGIFRRKGKSKNME